MKSFVLKKNETDQVSIASEPGLPPSVFCSLLGSGMRPRREPARFRAGLHSRREGCGADGAGAKDAFTERNSNNPAGKQKEILMIRKQSLTPQAKRKFRIPREIFSDELSEAADIFFSPEIRYVSECLYQTAKHGGMTALTGESGSGKSTLVRCLEERLTAEGSRVKIIKPYVLGMDSGSKKAVAMKPTHLCEAILTALHVSSKGNLSAEALFKLTHEKLIESAQAGYKHLLIIEEAHSLPPAMFSILKRFFELYHGLGRLLSILLVGQKELEHKLAEGSKDVREVVQRLELVELHALDDLEGYVRHRCNRAGANYESIFSRDALSELSLRLTGPKDKRGNGKSMAYPLLIGNMLTKAINMSEALKMEKVTADIIRAM